MGFSSVTYASRIFQLTSDNYLQHHAAQYSLVMSRVLFHWTKHRYWGQQLWRNGAEPKDDLDDICVLTWKIKEECGGIALFGLLICLTNVCESYVHESSNAEDFKIKVSKSGLSHTVY